MYSEYIKRRKDNISKSQAVFFDDVESVHEKFMFEWLFEDVEYSCFELYKHNYIEGSLADNSISNIDLTTKAIAMLEVTFSDKMDNALEFAAKLKNAIPFI